MVMLGVFCFFMLSCFPATSSKAGVHYDKMFLEATDVADDFVKQDDGASVTPLPEFTHENQWETSPATKNFSVSTSSRPELTWKDTEVVTNTSVKNKGDLELLSTGTTSGDVMSFSRLNGPFFTFATAFAAGPMNGSRVFDGLFRGEETKHSLSHVSESRSDHVITTEWSDRGAMLEMAADSTKENRSSGGTRSPANLCSVSVVSEDILVDYHNDSQEAPPVLSPETYAYISKVLDNVRLPWDVTSGLLTLTSTCIYMLPGMRSPTGYYLVSMNLFETLSALTGVVGLWWRTVDGPEVAMVCAMYINLCCRRCVYWLAVVVSIERVFAVKCPLRARYGKLVRFPMLFILADVTATVAFHTYIPLSYRVVQKEATCQYHVTFTALYLQQVDDFQIVSNAAKYIFAYLPLLAGVCTNVALYLALQQESRTHLSLCAVHQGAPLRKKMLVQRQLALAILVSNTVFTLLSLPNNTIHLVSTYHATFGLGKRDHHLYLILSHGALLLVDLSRVTSFLSYVTLSTKFRRNVLRMLTPRSALKKLGAWGMGDLTRATVDTRLQITFSSGAVPTVTGSMSVSYA
ncbi:uncharacterized protein LOC112574804 isoform X2 [Pomacea canaliculata]|uniref:uncharacterized protein LOC112574804 isoform X2 n=1 Tax=Pomacea canaliculata TaxID=400727 RepID=UPI000D737984|nr:uncharacterized protein LOC112574804 isoform X2 [Pomacea canaliculata]